MVWLILMCVDPSLILWLFDCSVFYTNICSYRYLVNPTREVKWHWLSLCFACGAVLSKETGIMALAINVGFGLYRSYTSRLKLRNTFKRLFWTDTLTVKYSFFLALVSGKKFWWCFKIPIFYFSFLCFCPFEWWCKIPACQNSLLKITLLHFTRVF